MRHMRLDKAQALIEAAGRDGLTLVAVRSEWRIIVRCSEEKVPQRDAWIAEATGYKADIMAALTGDPDLYGDG